jgi:hypothetical protein
MGNVYAECLGETLRRDAALNRAPDHEMLLNGRQPIDPAIVGISLVVLGHQARCVGIAHVAQYNQANMPVEEHVLRRFLDCRRDRKRFDQADIFN